MAIIQSGSAVGTALLVDPAFGAARISVRPVDVLGWNSVGAVSGALTGLAAGAAVFSFRNLSGNPVLVRRLGVGFVTTTAFTAAQMMSFGLIVARSFTTSDTGGTAIALTGSNAKHRTTLATPTSLDCRISTTAALGAGTGATTALNVSAYEIDIDADGRGRMRFLAPVAEKRVVVSLQAGLAVTWAALPENLRHGIIRLVAHYHVYRDRADEPGPPAAVAALWRASRRVRWS